MSSSLEEETITTMNVAINLLTSLGSLIDAVRDNFDTFEFSALEKM